MHYLDKRLSFSFSQLCTALPCLQSGFSYVSSVLLRDNQGGPQSLLSPAQAVSESKWPEPVLVTLHCTSAVPPVVPLIAALMQTSVYLFKVAVPWAVYQQQKRGLVPLLSCFACLLLSQFHSGLSQERGQRGISHICITKLMTCSKKT